MTYMHVVTLCIIMCIYRWKSFTVDLAWSRYFKETMQYLVVRWSLRGILHIVLSDKWQLHTCTCSVIVRSYIIASSPGHSHVFSVTRITIEKRGSGLETRLCPCACIILFKCILQCSALRGSHGDYLNSLVIKLIYPTDAKKVNNNYFDTCMCDIILYDIVLLVKELVNVLFISQAKQVMDLFQQSWRNSVLSERYQNLTLATFVLFNDASSWTHKKTWIINKTCMFVMCRWCIIMYHGEAP